MLESNSGRLANSICRDTLEPPEAVRALVNMSTTLANAADVLECTGAALKTVALFDLCLESVPAVCV